MKLDYEEIEDGDQFEDLVADYFRELQKVSDNSIMNVDVQQSGVGTDGGRDIIVDLEFSDDVKVFTRRWVVQCKFRDHNINLGELSSVNIPTLIHSYKASGYLLICKKRPTSKVTEMFERLNRDCKDRYQYECWNGNALLNKLYLVEDIHQNYFPKFRAEMLKLKSN